MLLISWYESGMMTFRWDLNEVPPDEIHIILMDTGIHI